MQDSVFQILFLGENASWSKLSQAVAASPETPLQVQRLDSLADLFQSLAAGQWQGLAVDIHSWNFQGLHYVEKVRSEYPALPIVALYSPSVREIDMKAMTSGASRCISLSELSAETLHAAIASTLSESKSQFILEKGPQMRMPSQDMEGVTISLSKNQVITHALSNLLCVISANADLLADSLRGSGPDPRPLSEIKKAAQSAAALMRHLK
jgi:DNA-binding NarL/FixJ family response regulator